MPQIGEADKDVATLTEKVSALETSIPATETLSNSIENVVKSLHEVIPEMSSGTVEPALVKQTEAHMSQLLEGVQPIAAGAKVAADANKNDTIAGVGGGEELRSGTDRPGTPTVVLEPRRKSQSRKPTRRSLKGLRANSSRDP